MRDGTTLPRNTGPHTQSRKETRPISKATMVRPRNALLAAFPPGTLTPEEASEALRKAGGDVEAAKRAITASRRNDDQSQPSAPSAASASAKNGGNNANKPSPSTSSTALAPLPPRQPPRHSTAVNNLSYRQYCCVWSVEVYEDGYRPDVARTLLSTVARHVNPILRARGWRVKRLIESESKKWIGLCTGNGRNDADAASTNIQLNLRVEPDRHCRTFRSFHQILAVMLHEITHTSIGLEDIHPPAFYELLDEIKAEYREKLHAGEVDLEKDDYGTNGQFITNDGCVGSVAQSATDVLGQNGSDNLGLLGAAGGEGECGASKKKGRRRGRRGGGGGGKRRGGGGAYSAGYTSNVPKGEMKRPLLKGVKMIDKRTKKGRAAMGDRENLTPRELAAKAALARLGGGDAGETGSAAAAAAVKDGGAVEAGNAGHEICIDISSDDDNDVDDVKAATKDENNDSFSSDGQDEEEDEDEPIEHNKGCGCRSCDWSNMFFMPKDEEESNDFNIFGSV